MADRLPDVPPLAEEDCDGGFVDRLAAVTRACAGRPAVVHGEVTLSFDDLDAWSDVLAETLLAETVQAETVQAETRLAETLLDSVTAGDPAAADTAGDPDAVTAARSAAADGASGEAASGEAAGGEGAGADGAGADGPVAILLGHDVAAVVAMVAVLKAGRPFLPLDALLPRQRLAQIIGLAGATVCVTDAGHRAVAAALPGLSRLVDVGKRPGRGSDGGVFTPAAARDGAAHWTPGTRERVARLAPRRGGADPAAVLFTSGSTGTPKGVVWNHHTFLYHHWAFQEALQLGPAVAIPMMLPLNFVAGANTTSWGLLSGAPVHLYELRTAGTRELADWLRRMGPAALVVTPSMLRTVLDRLEADEVLAGVRFVITLGEAAYARDIERTRRHVPSTAAFITSYGSSEAGPTSMCVITPQTPVPAGVLPAGWPLDGKRLEIWRDDGTPAAAGESGEVVVFGRYLSAGYWRSPELGAGRFLEAAGGERGYRSGDIGRIDADGCLRVTGRIDGAVKVRGYLVEPIEIEAALLATDEIADAVVVADRPATGLVGPDRPVGPVAPAEVRLIAYVVPAAGVTLSPAMVRRLLWATLPAYMIPPTVVILTELPRTDRGKVDRMGLPAAPVGPRLGADPPGDDPYESAVVLLWARLLQLETVGLHDDFVELGGDSLIAQELVTAARDEFGVRLPVSVIADAPTPAEFAALLASGKNGLIRHPTVVPLITEGHGAPLFCFPGAGGLAIGLLPFARHFAGERRVYGMQAHALEQRGIPDWSVEAAARRHVGEIRLLQPTGPYLLVGHSFGGLVAFEVAQILEQAGHEVGLLAVIDTYLPGTSRITRSGAIVPTSHLEGQHPDRPAVAGGARGTGPLSDDDAPPLSPRVLAGRFRQMVQLPLAGVVRFRGLNQYDVFYNQGRILTMAYRPRTYAGRTLVWLADDHDEIEAWRGVLTGPSTIRRIGGDHDTVIREPLISEVVADLRREIAEVPGVNAPAG